MSFGVVASVGGAVLGAAATSSAAGKQQAAAQQSMEENARQFNVTRKDNKPWRDAGASGINQLAYLLGLPGYSSAGNEESLRKELLPQFTKTSTSAFTPPAGAQQIMDALGRPTGKYYTQDQRDGAGYWENYDTGAGSQASRYVLYGNGNPTSTIDEAGLNAEIQKRLSAGRDSNFGSLLKKFGIEDFEADPGYAFRQSEGQKGVERSAAARGSLFSGAAGKALTKFNQDLASQEYGNAYNRYNNDQSNVFNRLAAVSGIGQAAQGQVNQAASQYSANTQNALAGMGNASAAGAIGVGNALTGGLNSYANYNQLNNILNRGNPSVSTPNYSLDNRYAATDRDW